MEANMEKRSSLFYFVLFFLAAIFSFRAGTGGIMDFIGIDKSNSFFTEMGLAWSSDPLRKILKI
jgi:hypothetical protein